MELHVVGLPPYKQACADASEKKNQQERSNTLKEAAREQKQAIISNGKVRLSITYYRSRGRSDASNIIGGISDALNGLAYIDDRQIDEIHYIEEKGIVDEYEVIVETK
jgi:Holliday junction resolvase RusA-like endonuclease